MRISVEADTRRNVFTYYVNFVVVAAIGFVVNPLLLTALGPVAFGIWKSLQRYLDFATVADGRATQALKWIVANRASLSTADKQRDIGAAIVVWVRWLPIAVLVVAMITIATPVLIKGIPPQALSTVYATAAVLAANTVLAGFLYIPDSVLVGYNQGYKSMLVTTVVYILSNCAMIAVAYSGGSLWTLAAIVLVAALFNSLLTLVIARRAVPWWGLKRPSSEDVKRVFGYSAWTVGGMAVDKLLLASELIVISVMAGAVVVTHFTFTSYVMQFVLSIALVTASGFMPLLGSQLGAGNQEAAAARARSVRHLVFGIISLGSAGILAFNGVFVTLWAGHEQFMGNTLNVVLTACALQQALIRMDAQVLDVTMRIAPRVIVGLVATVAGIGGGCVVFAVWHNLTFALLAVVLARLGCNVVYPVFVARLIPGSSVPRISIVLGGALLVISGVMGPLVQDGNLPTQIGLVLVWLVAAGGCAWIGLVPRATVRALLSRGK